MCCCECGIITLVVLLNILVHLCGASILGLGVWAMIGDRSCIHEVIISNTHEAVLLVIVAGVVIMLTSCLGCYATCTESKKGIVSYSVFSLCVVTAQVIGCILLFVIYRSQVDRVQQQYDEECKDDQSVAEFNITQGMFQTFYYALSGATIFSILCELVALLLIVCQYQDIM